MNSPSTDTKKDPDSLLCMITTILRRVGWGKEGKDLDLQLSPLSSASHCQGLSQEILTDILYGLCYPESRIHSWDARFHTSSSSKPKGDERRDSFHKLGNILKYTYSLMSSFIIEAPLVL
jgi:hypothetical protein